MVRSLQALQQKLAMRHRIRPWGGGQFKPALTPTAIAPFVPEEAQSRDSRTVPDVRLLCSPECTEVDPSIALMMLHALSGVLTTHKRSQELPAEF